MEKKQGWCWVISVRCWGLLNITSGFEITQSCNCSNFSDRYIDSKPSVSIFSISASLLSWMEMTVNDLRVHGEVEFLDKGRSLPQWEHGQKNGDNVVQLHARTLSRELGPLLTVYGEGQWQNKMPLVRVRSTLANLLGLAVMPEAIKHVQYRTITGLRKRQLIRSVVQYDIGRD